MDPGVWIGLGSGVFTIVVVALAVVISLVATLLGVALPVALVLWLLKRQQQARAEEARLLREGTRSTATVMTLRETGIYVNHRPQVALRLLIEDPTGGSFEASVDRVVSMVEIPRVQPGCTLAVAWDPQDRGKLAIDLG